MAEDKVMFDPVGFSMLPEISVELMSYSLL